GCPVLKYQGARRSALLLRPCPTDCNNTMFFDISTGLVIISKQISNSNKTAVLFGGHCCETLLPVEPEQTPPPRHMLLVALRCLQDRSISRIHGPDQPARNHQLVSPGVALSADRGTRSRRRLRPNPGRPLRVPPSRASRRARCR